MQTTTYKEVEDHNKEILLRLVDVLRIVPVSKTTWYQMMKDKIAPEKIKFGGRASFWKKSEVMAMVERHVFR